MSKFWQKKYTSKYTGKEIDAAVAKAGSVPDVTSADAGKALVVDEEGKIVTGEVSSGDRFADKTWTAVGNLSTMSIEFRSPQFNSIQDLMAYEDYIISQYLKGKNLYQATVTSSTIPVLPEGVSLTFELLGTVGSNSEGSTFEGPLVFGYGAQLLLAAISRDPGVGINRLTATVTLNLG